MSGAFVFFRCQTYIENLDEVAHKVEEGEHGDGDDEQEDGLHRQEDHRVQQVVAGVLVQHTVQGGPVQAQRADWHALVESQGAGQRVGHQHLVVGVERVAEMGGRKLRNLGFIFVN